MCLPVCHNDHVVGGSPEGVDDGGVASDHDDARDDKGHDELIPGEVHTAHDITRLMSVSRFHCLTQNSPHCHCSR